MEVQACWSHAPVSEVEAWDLMAWIGSFRRLHRGRQTSSACQGALDLGDPVAILHARNGALEEVHLVACQGACRVRSSVQAA